MTSINLIGLKQFKQTAVDKLHSEIASIGGSELLPTVSLCHQCHYHVPAWRYHKDGKVYMVKHCVTHGISHHMIESDYEFYKSLEYVKNTERFNFNGGITIEGSDRCNLDCPHCYHLPDNDLSDKPMQDILDQLARLPLGKDAIHTVHLSGAESTLRSDFCELISAIKTLYPDVSVGVLTNGIRFGNAEFVNAAKEAGLGSANVGLNHPSYNDYAVIRAKQVRAIETLNQLDLTVNWISYTMIDLSELDFVLNEITTSTWKARNFRLRTGSEIGRNASTGRLFVSDIYKAVEQWCKQNNKSFERIEPADNNIYHVMVNVGGKTIRVIQWCDETDIDMEELRAGPWGDFVPDGVTNFLHQIIRRDVWKNQNLILPDTPPLRYQFNRNPSSEPLDLLKLYE
jgi:hypothetical protein